VEKQLYPPDLARFFSRLEKQVEPQAPEAPSPAADEEEE